MNEKRACDVLAYAAASAREMYVDPSVYASHRLLATMERFLGFLEEEQYNDPFFSELRKSINDNILLVMTDPEKFGDFLSEVVEKVAHKSFEYA
ncbi:MAG: DUF6092 family protein [Oscillospiraceae bacterium]|nr:DUF6092 family protein [Oscillospiraceae bacterium]